MRRSPALSAEAFIDACSSTSSAARHVVIGYDFRFGKGRGGDPETLQRAGAAHGFGVTVVAQVAEAGEVFSSSAIRAELAQGDVKGAAQMLGWWWRVSGKVIGGAKRGTGLGFPTANIALAPGHGAGARHLRGARPRRRRAPRRPPPTSARGRPSTTARRCWRCSCSTSTATSTAARSRWSSSTSSAATAASTASRRCKAQMARDCDARAKSWRLRLPSRSSRKRGNDAGASATIVMPAEGVSPRAGTRHSSRPALPGWARIFAFREFRMTGWADAARSVAMQRYPAKLIARIIGPVAR